MNHKSIPVATSAFPAFERLLATELDQFGSNQDS